MSNRFSTLAACCAILLATAACGDAAGPGDDIAGTYDLRNVDGKTLPATILQFGNERVEILAGQIRIENDGRFRSSITRRDWIGSESNTFSQVDEGTWGRTGNRLTLTFPDGDRDAATIEGNTLRVESAGFIFVFVRTS